MARYYPLSDARRKQLRISIIREKYLEEISGLKDQLGKLVYKYIHDNTPQAKLDQLSDDMKEYVHMGVLVSLPPELQCHVKHNDPLYRVFNSIETVKLPYSVYALSRDAFCDKLPDMKTDKKLLAAAQCIRDAFNEARQLSVGVKSVISAHTSIPSMLKTAPWMEKHIPDSFIQVPSLPIVSKDTLDKVKNKLEA